MLIEYVSTPVKPSAVNKICWLGRGIILKWELKQNKSYFQPCLCI